MKHLEQLPVQAKSCWISKQIDLHPRHREPATTWSLRWELSASAEMLATAVFSDTTGIRWRRAGWSTRSKQLELDLSFVPFDWRRSEGLQVGLDVGGRMEIEVPDVANAYPERITTVEFSDHKIGSTGAVNTLARIEAPDEMLFASVLLISAADARPARRDRWRVDATSPTDIPSILEFVGTTRRSRLILPKPGRPLAGGSLAPTDD